MKFLTVDDQGKERVVYGELLTPGVPTGFADFHTKESIRDFTYALARSEGLRLDINHDALLTDKYIIVETFIARECDDTFTPGALVLGAQILDDDLWQDILDQKINGFSYEGVMTLSPMELEVPESQVVTGYTEPDVIDGHVHSFAVLLNSSYTPVAGSTGETNNHTHQIVRPVITSESFGHSHRYDFLGKLTTSE